MILLYFTYWTLKHKPLHFTVLNLIWVIPDLLIAAFFWTWLLLRFAWNEANEKKLW